MSHFTFYNCLFNNLQWEWYLKSPTTFYRHCYLPVSTLQFSVQAESVFVSPLSCCSHFHSAQEEEAHTHCAYIVHAGVDCAYRLSIVKCWIINIMTGRDIQKARFSTVFQDISTPVSLLFRANQSRWILLHGLLIFWGGLFRVSNTGISSLNPVHSDKFLAIAMEMWSLSM